MMGFSIHDATDHERQSWKIQELQAFKQASIRLLAKRDCTITERKDGCGAWILTPEGLGSVASVAVAQSQAEEWAEKFIQQSVPPQKYGP